MFREVRLEGVLLKHVVPNGKPDLKGTSWAADRIGGAGGSSAGCRVSGHFRMVIGPDVCGSHRFRLGNRGTGADFYFGKT